MCSRHHRAIRRTETGLYHHCNLHENPVQQEVCRLSETNGQDTYLLSFDDEGGIYPTGNERSERQLLRRLRLVLAEILRSRGKADGRGDRRTDTNGKRRKEPRLLNIVK